MLAQITHSLSGRLHKSSVAALLITGTAAFAPAWVQAQEFLSIKGNVVNVRAKPNTRAEIAWELIQGYPLEVIATEEDWVKVKDFEGPLGWVHRPLTTNEPHFLVKAATVNLRSGPSTSQSVVTKLKKYDIVKTLEKQGSWAKVQTTDGQQGWMSVDLGWGW